MGDFERDVDPDKWIDASGAVRSVRKDSLASRVEFSNPCHTESGPSGGQFCEVVGSPSAPGQADPNKPAYQVHEDLSAGAAGGTVQKNFNVKISFTRGSVNAKGGANDGKFYVNGSGQEVGPFDTLAEAQSPGTVKVLADKISHASDFMAKASQAIVDAQPPVPASGKGFWGRLGGALKAGAEAAAATRAAQKAARPSNTSPAGVYLLKDASGAYKIGKTTNFQQRLKELQTGNPNKIEVIGWKPVDLKGKTDAQVFNEVSQMETAYHHEFKKQHKNTGSSASEWFNLSDADVAKFQRS